MPFWEGQEVLTPLQWTLRTVVVLAWLRLVAKLMGQREIGRLTLFDFVVAIVIGSIAANALANPRGRLYVSTKELGTKQA